MEVQPSLRGDPSSCGVTTRDSRQLQSETGLNLGEKPYAFRWWSRSSGAAQALWNFYTLEVCFGFDLIVSVS